MLATAAKGSYSGFWQRDHHASIVQTNDVKMGSGTNDPSAVRDSIGPVECFLVRWPFVIAHGVSNQA
jgi:glycyl-tRNA synthetase alpha subunit